MSRTGGDRTFVAVAKYAIANGFQNVSVSSSRNVDRADGAT